MSTPKRQHTVPRVYLNNFTDKDGFLTVFSKRKGETLRLRPKDALVRKFYYSQPVDGEENKFHDFETKLLGQIETKYPQFYQSIVSRSDVDLLLLFETILSMRVRSAGFREPFEIALSDFVSRHLDSMPSYKFPPLPDGNSLTKDDITVSIDPHRSMYSMAFHLQNHCKAVSSSSFTVVKPSPNKLFLTSDNPVVWFEKAILGPPQKPYEVLPTAKTRVFLPLSPKLGLLGRPKLNTENSIVLRARELSAQYTNTLNYAILASAWDHIVGGIKLPEQLRLVAERSAPELSISNYSPSDGAFAIESWEWAPLRHKSKF